MCAGAFRKRCGQDRASGVTGRTDRGGGGREPFVFGVPLIARASAGDWAVVERLFALTLTSVLAQADADWRLLVAGHDRPAAWARVADDPRCAWLQADWAPAAPDRANNDGGRKKWLVTERVLATGGGLLMFLDADDWVDAGLVACARSAIGPGAVGGVVAHGLAVDAWSGRAAAFPVAGYDHDFAALCGSSTVGRVDPAGARPVDRDPHAALGSHGEWRAAAAANGWRLAELDVWGAYVVGTGQSHSEAAGPFAHWRRGFSDTVRRTGAVLDAGAAARFGLAPAVLGAHQGDVSA